MSVTYGFDISCGGLSAEELKKFLAVILDHPIGWVGNDDGLTVRANYVYAYVESSCPANFDDAVAALEDAVQCVWRALGRYVEVSADVFYIEDTPSDSVETDEDSYQEWLAEQ